jgi:hypothetical protein
MDAMPNRGSFWKLETRYCSVINNLLEWVYPNVGSMLLLCDKGGSNACLYYIEKQDVRNFSKHLRMSIPIAYYPAYCSKWNSIEHKLFSHLHKTWQVAIFHDIQILKEFVFEISTTTVLNIKVNINNKTCQTDRKVIDDLKKILINISLLMNKFPNGSI